MRANGADNGSQRNTCLMNLRKAIQPRWHSFFLADWLVSLKTSQHCWSGVQTWMLDLSVTFCVWQVPLGCVISLCNLQFPWWLPFSSSAGRIKMLLLVFSCFTACFSCCFFLGLPLLNILETSEHIFTALQSGRNMIDASVLAIISLTGMDLGVIKFSPLTKIIDWLPVSIVSGLSLWKKSWTRWVQRVGIHWRFFDISYLHSSTFTCYVWDVVKLLPIFIKIGK